MSLVTNGVHLDRRRAVRMRGQRVRLVKIGWAASPPPHWCPAGWLALCSTARFDCTYNRVCGVCSWRHSLPSSATHCSTAGQCWQLNTVSATSSMAHVRSIGRFSIRGFYWAICSFRCRNGASFHRPIDSCAGNNASETAAPSGSDGYRWMGRWNNFSC